MKLIWAVLFLATFQNAWALDIGRVPVCEGTSEPRIPLNLVGTYQKLRSSFVIDIHGVEHVPDILVGAGRDRIPEDQIERDYCKHINLRTNNNTYYLDIDVTRYQETLTGWNRHTLVYRLEYNSRTQAVRGGFQSARFGMTFGFIPGGRPASVRMLVYRKL